VGCLIFLCPATAGFRELSAFRRTQTGTGALGLESSVAPVYGMLSNHDVEAYEIGGSTHTGVVWREADQFRFRRFGASSPIASFTSPGLGSGLSLSAYPESVDAPLRIHWIRAKAGQEYNEESRRQMRVRWSDDEFQTSTVGELEECTAMSGWYSCPPASTTPVASAYRLQTAYDASSSLTVTAWTDQRRTSGGPGDHTVRIAFGDVSAQLLAPAVQVPGLRTIVSPGVACNPQSAAGGAGGVYDCIVALADFDSDDSRIVVARFSGTTTSTHVEPTFDSITTVVNSEEAETTAGIAAWYSDSAERWFLAFLATDPGQPLRVYESADTLNWTKSGDYGTSLLAPRLADGGAGATYIHSAR
jgi:hypothetical protein